MNLINNSDKEAVIVKYTKNSTILRCRIPRIQSSTLPQSSTQCIIDVSVKGEQDQQKSKQLEYILTSQLSKCINRQAYSGTSIKIIFFILNEGDKLLQGLVNVGTAALLLAGISMNRTLYASQKGPNYIVLNLITGNIVSCKSKQKINMNLYDQERKQYKDYIKRWLMGEITK